MESKIRKIAKFGFVNEEEDVVMETPVDVQPDAAAVSAEKIRAFQQNIPQEIQIDLEDINKATEQMNTFIKNYVNNIQEQTTVKRSAAIYIALGNLKTQISTIITAMSKPTEEARLDELKKAPTLVDMGGK